MLCTREEWHPTLRHALKEAQVRLAQRVQMYQRSRAPRPGQLGKSARAGDGAAEAAACGHGDPVRASKPSILHARCEDYWRVRLGDAHGVHPKQIMKQIMQGLESPVKGHPA